MNINVNVGKSESFRAFYLFFIVHTIQIGAGLMGVPRILFLKSESDAWISILIGGMFLHLIMWVMFKILREYENADILGIQYDLFGRYIGSTLGCAFIVYIFLILLTVIKNYIEVVQVFIFPEMPIWLMALFLISLMVYAILGGIRVVVGTCFIFFFLTIWLVFTIYKPMTYMDLGHFFPVFQTSPLEILSGAREMTFSVLGLEVLLFVYPFVDNKKHAQLPAQLGIAMTTSLVLLVTVVSIGYFSPYQLKESVWATLSLFKVISFSMIERFDFIAVSLWMMVVLPNIIMFCWILQQSLNRLFKVKKKISLYCIAAFLFFGSIVLEYRLDINRLTTITAKVGFYLVFIYPLLVYLALMIRKLWRKGRSS